MTFGADDQPPEGWGGLDATGASPGAMRSLADIEPIEPTFVDYPLLQTAMFHLLTGKPGVGKGALCAHWISRCTTGEMYGTPKRALWLSSEEDAARDLRPRLEVAGADLTHVSLIPDSFKLPRDVAWLQDEIERQANVGLVVIDPISNHLEQTNSSVEEEVRQALQPLSRVCEMLDVVMLGIRHVSTKDGRGNFLSRILGSTSFVGIARCVLGVAQDYDGSVHVRALKGNRVPTAESGRRFTLVGASYRDWSTTVPMMEANGESHLDFDTLVGMINRQAIGGDSETAREMVVTVLREHGGSMESDRLDAEVAGRLGITTKTVRNLRTELKDRGWLRAYPERDENGADFLHWNVALTNAVPFLEASANPLVTEGSTVARARVAGVGQLELQEPSADPDTGRDLQEPSQIVMDTADPVTPTESVGISETEVSGSANEEVSGSAVCPVCGSTNVGGISGRCHDCGSKVHDGTDWSTVHVPGLEEQ